MRRSNLGVYEQEEQRYGSDAEDQYRYSYGRADEDEDETEEGSSNPSISVVTDKFKDTEENDPHGSTTEDAVRMRRRPDYSSTGFGNPAGFAQSIRDSPSSTGDAAVNANAHPAF
ncbi:hypothetical protein R3P38DRAFT_3176595 [Favolaschia claudopus]|uniref:Uncharacterized protein n=1 Tax=Favolaschia claudopus TaxID=2862362 RepID=A0AAW0CZR7_9AGAR